MGLVVFNIPSWLAIHTGAGSREDKQVYDLLLMLLDDIEQLLQSRAGADLDRQIRTQIRGCNARDCLLNQDSLLVDLIGKGRQACDCLH